MVVSRWNSFRWLQQNPMMLNTLQLISYTLFLWVSIEIQLLKIKLSKKKKLSREDRLLFNLDLTVTLCLLVASNLRLAQCGYQPHWFFIGGARGGADARVAYPRGSLSVVASRVFVVSSATNADDVTGPRFTAREPRPREFVQATVSFSLDEDFCVSRFNVRTSWPADASYVRSVPPTLVALGEVSNAPSQFFVLTGKTDELNFLFDLTAV